MTDFFLAAGFLTIAATVIVWWQIRASREDKKAAGLKQANRGQGK